jgi:hypothetical protein
LFVCKCGADLVFLILHGQGESDAPAGSVAGTLQVFSSPLENGSFKMIILMVIILCFVCSMVCILDTIFLFFFSFFIINSAVDACR